MSQSYIWPAQVSLAPVGAATAANQVLEIADLDAIKASTASIDTKTRANDNTGIATQAITVQDTGSTVTTGANNQSFITGTPTAGSVASFNISNVSAVKIMTSGTWTGTLTVEKSIDGVTWNPQGAHQTGIANTSSSFTANFNGTVNATACVNVRIRATAAMTGTATVKIVTSSGEHTVIISNPIRITDNTNNAVIKAASTAPLATDPALVVTLSPNSATQAVSGTVTVTQATGTNLHTVVDSSALPTGASTSALQTSGNASLTSIDGKVSTSALQTTGNTSLASIDGKTPALGQALAAASVPVVLTASQLTTLTPPTTVTANQGTANATPWNQNISQVGGTPVAAGNGVATAGTLRVSIASDTPSNSNALNTKAAGKGRANAPTRVDYTGTSVTTAAYVTLVASLATTTTEIEIFDSSGQTLVLAVGAAASEVDQVIVFPGGNGRIPLTIAAGVRVSIKALSGTANVGEIDINWYT